MWSTFNKNLPESYLGNIGNDNLLLLLCLSVYTVLLGRCCRGWGCGQDAAPQPQEGASNPLGRPPNPTGGPLGGQDNLEHTTTASSDGGQVQDGKRPAMRGQLDLGTFLIGVDVSLRDLFPDLMVGVLGPLTNSKAATVVACAF